jgi:hypothetical protein
MDKGSLKVQSCDCLYNMVLDPQVQALWHTLGHEQTVRLAAMLHRLPSCFHAVFRSACAHLTQRDTSTLTLVRHRLENNAELQHTVFYILKTLCSSEETVKLLVCTSVFTSAGACVSLGGIAFAHTRVLVKCEQV